MSKSYYLHCKALHSLPKFASKTQRIQVGNGQHISVLFIIPVIIDIAGHRFEIYTLVSEIHENIDLVLGIKNVFELEGIFNSWECCFIFLNGSLPVFPKEKVIMKPREQKVMKIEAPFMDEISSLAIIKLWDKLTHSVMVQKVKFVCNIAMLDMINNSNSEALILNPGEALGILDLRSLGYYKIKQGVTQQKLNRFYEFESADEVCTHFNNLINTLRKEQKLDTGEKFPWLDNSDERKYMSDREILRKYINLDNTCLTEDDKEEVTNMLFKYKEAFSLRDEIGTCPNIEVGIDMMDKSPFFIRPYHVREEDKKVIDKEMKHLCYLGILKEGLSPYSSLVMLIRDTPPQQCSVSKKVKKMIRKLNFSSTESNFTGNTSFCQSTWHGFFWCMGKCYTSKDTHIWRCLWKIILYNTFEFCQIFLPNFVIVDRW